MTETDDILSQMRAYISANRKDFGDQIPDCATPSQIDAIARLDQGGERGFTVLNREITMTTALPFEPGTIGEYMRFPKTYRIGPRGKITEVC
jgi:hypothetical protein